MEEVLPSLFVLVVGAVATMVVQNRLSKAEQGLLWVGYVGHAASAVALVLFTLYYYRGGDMLGYHSVGALYCQLLYSDFPRYAPEMLRYIAQRPDIAFDTLGFAGTTTGSMIGISAWILFLVGGKSIYAACLLMGVLGHFAQLGIYSVIRQHIAVGSRVRAMAACVALPSVLYWSSGLVKEGVALIGVSLMFMGLSLGLDRRRWLAGILLLVVGGGVTSTVKPYILFAFLVSGVVWGYLGSARAKSRKPLRPLALVGALALGALGLMALGALFPRFAMENVAEEAAQLQTYGVLRQGQGSSYVIGNPEERSLSGQLLFAPIGLVYALFRPLPFEIRNFAMLLNGFETTLLTWLVLRTIARRGVRSFIEAAKQRPVLGFSVVFVVVLGAAVGTATTNIGTLSRYRVPMMPFYACVVALLSAHVARTPRRGTQQRRQHRLRAAIAVPANQPSRR